MFLPYDALIIFSISIAAAPDNWLWWTPPELEDTIRGVQM